LSVTASNDPYPAEGLSPENGELPNTYVPLIFPVTVRFPFTVKFPGVLVDPGAVTNPGYCGAY
jgi:hypothetical protein